MRIGLNGQHLLVEKPAGPEIYTYNIINALARVDTTSEYVVYLSSTPPPDFFDKLSAGNPNFSYKVVPKAVSWTQGGLAIELFENPIDVFFTPVHTMPVVRPSKMKTVAMIHGLEYRFSKRYRSFFGRLILAKPEEYTCKHSQAIIVPSNASKAAILREGWRVDPQKINIISEGVDDCFYKRTQSEIDKVKSKYGLEKGRYLLFVSTIQPRKNIPLLVAGFSRICEKFPDLKLVVAGKKGWLYEESLAAPVKYGVEDRVLFLGRVPQDDLPSLLSGASAFVSTSFEEGFGLPLLEAMSCEVPCMVSDIPAFRELGGGDVIYVNPCEVGSISSGLVEVLAGDNSEMVVKAWEKSRNYTWEEAARKTLKVFSEVSS